MDKAKIDRILGQVGKPVRYMGNEYNMVVKDPSEVLINFAFAFPDVYEVGMSHLGMKILYHLINEREDTYCQRVLCRGWIWNRRWRKPDSAVCSETGNGCGFDL